MPIRWRGEGVDTVGVDESSGREMIRIDPRYFRPTEVETLLGDASKAREKLGWEPEVSFDEMVAEMVAHDLEEARRDSICKREGFLIHPRHE